MRSSRSARLLSHGLLAVSLARSAPAQQQPAIPDPSLTLSPVSSPFPPPSETPPTPPKVSCQHDQLTIAADNSTLESVLNAVHDCLGIAIDAPPSSLSERSYFHLGPGPTREILDALLSSTDFNYVIESSNSSPEKIQMILVSSRTRDVGAPRESKSPSLESNLTLTPARRAWIAGRNTGRSGGAATDDAGSRPGEAETATPSAPASISTPSTAGSPDSPASTTPAPSLKDADVLAASGDAVAPVPPAPVALTAPPDPAQSSTAAQELRNRISDMQQLFEQRRKMIPTPSAPSTPN